MTVNETLASLLEREGAVAYGIAEAAPVEEKEWQRFLDWLDKGMNAGMTYMRNHAEIRRDPRMLLPGAIRVVSIAFNYRQPNPYPGLATYAMGEDYHKVLRRRLKRVVRELKGEFGGAWRICIDSAPVLERYWAVKAGVGVRSNVHGNVIVPGVGSMVFLAELVTTVPLNLENRNFITAEMSMDTGGSPHCPTGALLPGGMVNARKCINYLTIEHRESLSEEQKKLVGDAIFGCDVCQRGCVENRGRYIPVLQELMPLEGLDGFIKGNPEGFPIEKSPMKRSAWVMEKFLKKIKKINFSLNFF